MAIFLCCVNELSIKYDGNYSNQYNSSSNDDDETILIFFFYEIVLFFGLHCSKINITIGATENWQVRHEVVRQVLGTSSA